MIPSESQKPARLKIAATVIVALFAFTVLGSNLAKAEQSDPGTQGYVSAVQYGGGNMTQPSIQSTQPIQPNVGGVSKVLMACADDGNGEPMVSIIAAIPTVTAVDFYDVRYGTPSLSYLMDYDLVFTWSNYNYDDRVALGNVLADYVDAGGRVIQGVFNWATNWGIGGRIITGFYSPFQPGSTTNHYTWANLGSYDTSHPIMAGVGALGDNYRDYTILSPGAQLIASWSDGENLIAIKGGVVGINFYPGIYHDYTGDVPQLIKNIVNYLFKLQPLISQKALGPQDKPVEQSPTGNLIAANMVVGTGIIVLIAIWRRQHD